MKFAPSGSTQISELDDFRINCFIASCLNFNIIGRDRSPSPNIIVKINEEEKLINPLFTNQEFALGLISLLKISVIHDKDDEENPKVITGMNYVPRIMHGISYLDGVCIFSDTSVVRSVYKTAISFCVDGCVEVAWKLNAQTKLPEPFLTKKINYGSNS